MGKTKAFENFQSPNIQNLCVASIKSRAVFWGHINQTVLYHPVLSSLLTVKGTNNTN